MKKMILSLCLGLPVIAFAQQSATIKGSLGNIKDPISTIYYIYNDADGNVIDSAKVTKGAYTFKVDADLPALITLLTVDPNGEIRPTKKDVARVYLQAGVNTVSSKDSFSNVAVKESKAHAEYVKLTNSTLPIQSEMQKLVANYRDLVAKKDTAAIEKLMKDYDVLEEKMNLVYGDYVKANPKSPIALYALNQYAGSDLDAEKVEPLFSALPAATRASKAGEKFGKRVAIAKATSVGAMAPLFSQADTSGKQVSLASFRGKYVLVDFWASWCGPCRAENPNVVEAFNKYKDKNFTVLGVSLDDAERDGHKKWLAAIEKDKLTWTHVSDLKFWENEVAQQYGIRAIPQNFLLDPTGKIIAKNIRGEELQTKLAELIK